MKKILRRLLRDKHSYHFDLTPGQMETMYSALEAAQTTALYDPHLCSGPPRPGESEESIAAWKECNDSMRKVLLKGYEEIKTVMENAW